MVFVGAAPIARGSFAEAVDDLDGNGGGGAEVILAAAGGGGPKMVKGGEAEEGPNAVEGSAGIPYTEVGSEEDGGSGERWRRGGEESSPDLAHPCKDGGGDRAGYKNMGECLRGAKAAWAGAASGGVGEGAVKVRTKCPAKHPAVEEAPSESAVCAVKGTVLNARPYMAPRSGGGEGGGRSGVEGRF